MKFSLIVMMLMLTLHAQAESKCDVRTGTSMGIKVIEFASGNVIHSKMAVKEVSADALLEEMINLQDMGICEERIISQRCVLKFEKQNKTNMITLVRGTDRWKTWSLSSKLQAQELVKSLKRAGFCS